MITTITNWLEERATKRKKREYLKRHGCDSCCPECKKWESDDNLITTVDNDDGSVTRQCSSCSYKWTAIFTPAGFVPVTKENTK